MHAPCAMCRHGGAVPPYVAPMCFVAVYLGHASPKIRISTLALPSAPSGSSCASLQSSSWSVDAPPQKFCKRTRARAQARMCQVSIMTMSWRTRRLLGSGRILINSGQENHVWGFVLSSMALCLDDSEVHSCMVDTGADVVAACHARVRPERTFAWQPWAR